MTSQEQRKNEMPAGPVVADLVIIGAGAAGLMAACAAGERHIRCIVLEKRHRPGLKLLMCGNNRCNISHAGRTDELLAEYGQPCAEFLEPALRAFPPQALRDWFERGGLPTVQLRNRIYPKSEKADDVLHFFTDRLRDLEIPIMYNCAVKGIARRNGEFVIQTDVFSLTAKNVLIATGGVSYPKTGSTGDGAVFAEALGLKTNPFRPGLSAISPKHPAFLTSIGTECNHMPAAVRVIAGNREAGLVKGNLLLFKDVLRGSAIFDAVRLVGRLQPSSFVFEIDMFPEMPMAALSEKIAAMHRKISDVRGCINALGIDHGFCEGLAGFLQADLVHGDYMRAAEKLKCIRLEHAEIHPVKEAIMAIGGVAREEIDPATMQAKTVPGLFFAGETVDADGPTGGFNLHAAFATARLAIANCEAASVSGAEEKTPSRTEKRTWSRPSHDGRFSKDKSDKSSYKKSFAADGGKKDYRHKRDDHAAPEPSEKALRYGAPVSRPVDANKKKSAWGKNFWQR